MNFLEPWGLAGLTALAPVIALYFLKLKRQECVVPSTLLWKKVIDDLQVNAPFQRLKYSLLLLMQLIAVSLLGFALARPYLSMTGYAGKKTVLLIDTSASMSTRDAGADGSLTRLEAAVRDAQRKVEDLQQNDELAVVAFDHDVRQLSKFTRDRSELKRLLASLEPRDVETRADEAFETGMALIEGHTNAEVLVLTDGCFGHVKLLGGSDKNVMGNTEDSAATLANDKMSRLQRQLGNFRFVQYGSAESDNVGITQLDARTRPVRTTDENGKRIDALETQIFVMVENFSPKKRDVLLGLSTETLSFPPKLITLEARVEKQESLGGAEASANTDDASRSVEVFKLPVGTSGIVAAHILSPKDKFAPDDSANVVIGSREGTKLLLVTKGNYFLSKALGAMRSVDMTTMTPEDFQKEWDQKSQQAVEGFDACIFENTAPISWQEGGALFLGALPPLTGFSRDDAHPLEWPEVVDWADSHPLMRYVSFSNVTVAKAQNWKIPKTAKAIVETSSSPLVVAFESDRVRAVGVAFDIFSSDWAYRPSLPLFLRNVVPWVAQASPRRHPTCQQTGETLAIPAGLGVPTATLLRPGGASEKVELSQDHNTFVRGTEKAGLYYVKDLPGENGTRTYAFNLANRNESDNAARGSLKVGDVTMVNAPSAIEAKREIWRTLALAALGLLLLEWWVFHRRIGM